MNLTLKLLRIIGSPFAPEQGRILPENKSEALELYKYATKNKIGLLFLETLNKQGKISEFNLVSEYSRKIKNHKEQLITATRVAELLNSIDCDYALFKSIMPFPATPNDIDIIHFGSDDEYNTIINVFLRSGYREIVSPRGYPYPFKHDFHDARNGEHVDSSNKDIYDVDMYHGITVSYIEYLDEVKIRKYVTKKEMFGTEISSLNREADLVTIIVHSLITEQLLTLFSYYSTLYHLINSSIRDFITIAKENNVTFPVKVHCSLVAELHKNAHGFIPEKIDAIWQSWAMKRKRKEI